MCQRRKNGEIDEEFLLMSGYGQNWKIFALDISDFLLVE